MRQGSTLVHVMASDRQRSATPCGSTVQVSLRFCVRVARRSKRARPRFDGRALFVISHLLSLPGVHVPRRRLCLRVVSLQSYDQSRSLGLGLPRQGPFKEGEDRDFIFASLVFIMDPLGTFVGGLRMRRGEEVRKEWEKIIRFPPPPQVTSPLIH